MKKLFRRSRKLDPSAQQSDRKISAVNTGPSTSDRPRPEPLLPGSIESSAVSDAESAPQISPILDTGRPLSEEISAEHEVLPDVLAAVSPDDGSSRAETKQPAPQNVSRPIEASTRQSSTNKVERIGSQALPSQLSTEQTVGWQAVRDRQEPQVQIGHVSSQKMDDAGQVDSEQMPDSTSSSKPAPLVIPTTVRNPPATYESATASASEADGSSITGRNEGVERSGTARDETLSPTPDMQATSGPLQDFYIEPASAED